MQILRKIIRSGSFILGLGLLVFVSFFHQELLERYEANPYWIIGIIGVLSIYLIHKYFHANTRASRLERDFTLTVNHTFRTPLTRILWRIKEVTKEATPIKQKEAEIQNIAIDANKILEIVDLYAGVKNIKETSGYFFKAVSLRDILEESLAKYREEINKKNLKLQVPTFADVPMITLDRVKIAFVIDTIIENAIKYTSSNDSISIEYEANSSKITLIVSDTGIGLGPGAKLRLFSKFYRSKGAILKNPDGAGLKLYLAKQIVKRHKGRLYAKSKGKEKGASFFLTLPFQR